MPLSKLHPRQFWASESGLTALLVLLVLTIVVQYTAGEFALGLLLSDIFNTLVILAGVLTTIQQRWLRAGAILLAAAALLSSWAAYWRPERLFDILGAGLTLLFLGLLVAVVMIQVFRGGAVTGHRIRGAVVVYLLFGLIWALAYQVAALLLPGAFQLPANVSADDPDSLMRGMVYFSFITLTTLGYGDILPLHPTVRLLAIAEALTGQLFPAITLARLVSLAVMHQDKEP
jgi:voltage-gated potassium channel Kch